MTNRKGKLLKCAVCSEEVYRSSSKILRSKSKKYFCSKHCQTMWKNSARVGNLHPNWKGGEYAYRSVLVRLGKIKECYLCGTRDVRVLAVHHVDHNHINNTPSNLAWLCHNCHHLVHHDSVERQRFLEKLKNIE